MKNALVQAPDTAGFSDPLNITLLPALPKQWPDGTITNGRLRGGILLNLTWTDGRLSNASFFVDREITSAREVKVVYNSNVIGSFTTSKGLRRSFGRS
jgi:alpha-L-fucosidase 2